MISIIAAVGKNNELGKNNGLIWNIPKDLKFFREKTLGSTIIMGRNTFNSLPKVLPKRLHVVLSDSDDFNKELTENVIVVHSMEELTEVCHKLGKGKEIFVVGGASVYRMFIDIADKLYITHIEAEDKEADVYFPEIDSSKWRKKVLAKDEDNNIKFSHVEYTKI